MITIARMLQVLLAFKILLAAMVGGITGYLHVTSGDPSLLETFIFIEFVAGLSILVALLSLVPFFTAFVPWFIDVVIGVMWSAPFSLLVDPTGFPCSPLHSYWCTNFLFDYAFIFMSAVLWVVSGVVGFLCPRHHKHHAGEA